jgi:hypothetical protein
MPDYQIHRLKETQRQQFRWAPHTPGVTVVKLKDYEPGPLVEAASPYALWLGLRETDNAIAVGDLIEVAGELMAPGNGELRILKYIGFEEARWYVPEPVARATEDPVAVT